MIGADRMLRDAAERDARRRAELPKPRHHLPRQPGQPGQTASVPARVLIAREGVAPRRGAR